MNKYGLHSTGYCRTKFFKFVIFLLCLATSSSFAQEIYTFPDNTQTGWSSFENPTASKGRGGQENKGAKGHAAELLLPSQSKILLDIQGAGSIQRIWMTLSDRSPTMLRSLVLTMYWDGETKPAVSVPLGDFFGIGLGRTAVFQSALFSSPEGRSFNCNIPMPFRKAAKITITNQSNNAVVLFYDINFLKVTKHAANALYFHAFYSQNSDTKPEDDFEILPKINGRGRFLGCNLGIITDSAYGNSWWGEGEVKMYLDGDSKIPSLVGTGTEDYIGTAFLIENSYAHLYQGCPVADTLNKQWAFYRYHIPDPVFFNTDCRVAIQQIGADNLEHVRMMKKAGAQLKPVLVVTETGPVKLLERNPMPNLSDTTFPNGLTLFYRRDNYSATAYFYLDKPISSLPSLPALNHRIVGLSGK